MAYTIAAPARQTMRVAQIIDIGSPIHQSFAEHRAELVRSAASRTVRAIEWRTGWQGQAPPSACLGKLVCLGVLERLPATRSDGGPWRLQQLQDAASVYKISPSDLTFSWDECKYCFYLKVKHNIVLRGVFPGIFGRMANLTSQFYIGRPSSDISPTLPPGFVKMREGWVRSAPIAVTGAVSECYIKGRFDAVLEFEDGTYGIVDYKTSEAKAEQAAFYSRQLSAYAYALEHPAPDALGLTPVSRLGIFVITPDRFEPASSGEMVFVNRTVWMDVRRDDGAFLSLLGEVLAVLDAPYPPKPADDCEVCRYRETMQDFLAG